MCRTRTQQPLHTHCLFCSDKIPHPLYLPVSSGSRSAAAQTLPIFLTMATVSIPCNRHMISYGAHSRIFHCTVFMQQSIPSYMIAEVTSPVRQDCSKRKTKERIQKTSAVAGKKQSTVGKHFSCIKPTASPHLRERHLIMYPPTANHTRLH